MKFIEHIKLFQKSQTMNELNLNFSGMFLPPLTNQGGLPILPHPSLVFPGYRVANQAVGGFSMATKSMRAVRVSNFGGPEVLKASL